MSSFSETGGYYINPNAVTHISYTEKPGAKIHFIGGTVLRVTPEEADTLVDEMDTHGISRCLKDLIEKIDDVATVIARHGDQ